ncbi:MAG: hypothetical protein L0287_16985 [Anaerolineae bacterium]|nr:hypothetical protein [Anaerolineae bacterium]MCI0607680.1 hypothetical protein [Anaerolineae bacterium]
MNLIDKYIAEVGKHLPRKQRADIEAEIRSTLEDMLEERKQANGEVSEEQMIALLKEYGAPREVAESYTGPRYLIGPRVFPIFEMVTKIVVAVLLGLALVKLGLSLANSSLVGIEFLEKIGGSILELFGGLITAFGNIVLVFAILERVLPAKEFDEEEEWNPAELASEPDPDQVSIGEQIWGILFMAGFLVIFNLYANPDAWYIRENDWNFLSLRFTDAFLSYLPWINILAILEIALSLYMIRQGLWNATTRIINIALQLAWIVLSVLMLKGPDLIESTAGFSRIGNLMASVTLAIVIIVSSIEVAQMAYRLMKSRPSPPYPVMK